MSSDRVSAAPVVAVGVVGLVVAVALAWAQDYSAADTVVLVSLAVGGALVAGALGAVLLHGLRSRPVRTQTVVVALVTLVGTVVGVVLASSAMFVSSHDLGALLVVVVSSGTVGILSALALGSRVGLASRSLGERFRRIGGDASAEAGSADPGDEPIVGPDVGPDAGPEEFSRLADELERMSARLEASRARERALEASRRDLVAWVSHDLRTPLAGRSEEHTSELQSPT